MVKTEREREMFDKDKGSISDRNPLEFRLLGGKESPAEAVD